MIGSKCLLNSHTKASSLSEFNEWCSSKGVQRAAWDIGYLDGGVERGGFALKDIPENTILISVPLNASIVCAFESPCPYPPSFASPDIWIEGTWDIRMALRLLYERHLGQESTLKEYIRVLPSYIPSLIHYSSEELAELQDPELEDRAHRTQQSARAKFDRVAPAIATPPTWATWSGRSPTPTVAPSSSPPSPVTSPSA